MSGQQQPPENPFSGDDDFEKILANFADPNAFQDASSLHQLDPTDIDAIIGSTNDPFGRRKFFSNPSNQYQPPDASITDSTLLELIDDAENAELLRSILTESYDTPPVYQASTDYSVPSAAMGHSPAETSANDNIQSAYNIVYEQNRRLKNATKSRRQKAHTVQSNAVGPVNYTMQSSGCQPYTTDTVQMESGYAYEQQWQEYGNSKSPKIQIKCQPRPEFRPRTEKESRNSAHYIRCQAGVKPEYPTIEIPYHWQQQSEVNYIEVALLGVDKEAHVYGIDNKQKADAYKENALIFRLDKQNVLYFRVTDEDFRTGHKTFNIEFIKSKQNDEITKELIRARRLDQSILCFTRLYQLGKGDFFRDDSSSEYSSEMKEDYGDIEIEHIGPRYGPMNGTEMVYIVFKGRILKNDISITVQGPMNTWNVQVGEFTKSGNVVFFSMPACQYPTSDRVEVDILVSYKQDELGQYRYIYKGSLDQELQALRLTDSLPATTTAASSSSHPLDPFNFFSATNTCPKFNSRRASKVKQPKRLSNT